MSNHRTKAALLSVIGPGLGQIYNQQFIKGLIYLLVDAFGLYYFINNLPHALWGIVTLGDVPTRTMKVGKIYKNVAGDHSIFLLIEGLICILAFLIFAWFYYSAIKDAFTTGKLRDEGKKALSFRANLTQLLDARFPQIMLTLPALGILFLTIMPIIFMIMLAFTNYSSPEHVPPAKLVDWVGFNTFIDLVKLKTWSGTFLGVFQWTVIWAVMATVTTYFGGILVALLIQQAGIRFKTMWRTIFIIPYAIPQIISLLLMRNLFNGQFGPINQYLSFFGLEKLPWLTDPTLAKITLIVVNMWVGIPVSMVLILGVLTSIPKELYEAADIDGATPFHKFKSITLPFILFTTAPILIMQFAGNINNFNVIFLLTGGEPVNGAYQYAGHTDLLVTWLFKLTFNNSKYNVASAIGIIIFLIIATLSIISYRRTKSFKEEDMMR